MDTTIEFTKLAISEAGSEGSPNGLHQLIQAAAAGDSLAFQHLVQLYQDRIYHFCYQWVRVEEDAREACQDTFVRAFQHLNRYHPRGSFEAWLYKIALNRCRDHHKSRAARTSRLTRSIQAPEAELPSAGDSPDESATRSDDLRKLRRGIQLLPERLRAVVILHGIEGLNQDTCAEILGCSIRAVEGRFYRAKKLLATWWETEP